MIDIKLIRDNPQDIETAAKNKGVVVNVAHILEIDQKYRELLIAVQELREERNKFSKAAANPNPTERAAAIEGGTKLKAELEQKENALLAVKDELDRALLAIPNPSKPDVKAGKDDTENDVIKTVGTPKQFSFKPKDHMELGEALGIIDTERAAKVSGARFAYLKGDAVMLEFALKQLAFDILVQEGFIPVIPPVLIKTETMRGLGYMENGGDEDMFHIPKDNLTLVGTAEHSIVTMHMDETLEKKDLPRRYVGFSPAFRREAGSYGKDTKGIFRVHQFDKIEMVTFVEEGKDDEEQEYLLSLEEKFFQLLDIPYQVVKMCTGDLGFPAARKYDIEAWIPSQEKYREVTSVSTVTDFQSRRLNMRYNDEGTRKYLQVLNGTAFSMNRPIIAIMENYQQEDGSIEVPQVLQKYLGKDKISPKK